MIDVLEKSKTVNIFKKDYAHIIYEEDKQLGVITWNGKSSSEEYQNAFSIMLEFQKTHDIFRYISDIRNQSVVSPLDRKWLENVAMPKAIKQGLKAVAVVFDGNIFKKYYLNVILATSNKYKLPLKIFTDMEQAERWIMTKF